MARIEVIVTAWEQIFAGSEAELTRTIYQRMAAAGIPMKGFWCVERGQLAQHEHPLNGCVVYTWTDEEAK